MRYSWARLALVVLVTPAHAADQLQYGPAPAWVAAQQFQSSVPAAADTPFDFLLSDTQVKLEPGEMATYSHYAIRVNSSQGLSLGNVVAAWDPAFDVYTIHRVALHRGSQTIDVLEAGQKFTVLRREQNLEQQTLTGHLTATLQPEGLQVGDIVEVESTWVRRDPTLRNHMELKGSLGLPMRVNRASMRLVAPTKAALRQHTAKGMPAPVITQSSGQKISTWTISPLVPERAPAFAPDRFAMGRTLEVSDYQSWNELGALFVPLFEKASQLPPGSPLQQEVALIKAASADPVERAELALQLVEEKIRYVNLALGVGGLVPAAADETWARRFGDCKAKSALLVGLLRELGIEAVPVLVHSEEGDGINERLPMVSLFNHVVVRTIIGGKTYWLDGTRSGDRKLSALEVPFYHWGLPIVRNADLVRIMPDPATRPYLDTEVRTDASAGVDKPVPTVIDMTMRGDLAIAQNLFLSTLDPALRDEAIRKQLQQELDRFEIDKVATSYDPASQLFKLHGEGRQTLDLDKGIYWVEVPTLGYKADFRRSDMRDVDAPVKISYPSFSRYKQVILIPKDLVSQTKFQMPPIADTVAGVEYRRHVTNAAGVVTIETTRRALKPEISFAEAVAAQDRLRELDKADIWIRLSNSAPIATAEVKELIGHDPKNSGDYFQAAVKLLKKDETAQALGALNKAIEMAPRDANPRSTRAHIRMSEGDTAGAQSDAEAALKLDPSNVAMRRLLAELLRKSGNLEGAYAQAEAISKLDSTTAQMNRGEILLSLGRTEEALAAFDRALVYEKDPMIHVRRAQALSASDKNGRRRELDAGLKLNPTDAPTLVGLSQIASQLGDHNQALALLDQAFLKSPDDVHIRHARAIEMLLAGKEAPADKEFDALSAKDLTASELNELCWSKALANVALDRALEECDRSLAKDESPATHDSKGTVLLRQSRFDDAIEEFDTAMRDGEFAAPLYGRSIAYARKGDQTKSDADAAKATKLTPGIERIYAYYGLVR
ncbi:MAG TPA: DUF3857 domain-containing protein [Sphingomicrobium sp.]|nr:DUF3857 domain-containing protein [Sphingomicrobium sp.]